MSVQLLLEALALPATARVDQRIPKKLLLEHGASTAADRRQVQDGIDMLWWAAVLKPNTIGVPVFSDEQREYNEIAVLTVILRPAAQVTRLTELIHRAIPYPVVLGIEQNSMVRLSVAPKRRSLGEAEVMVVESVQTSTAFQPSSPTPSEAAFLASLALDHLLARDLYTIYQGWAARITALDAAGITGRFTLPETPERAETQQAAVTIYHGLQRELTGLRAQAERERQLSRRVELNLTIKRLEAQLAETAHKL
jgi:hypothetical protein